MHITWEYTYTPKRYTKNINKEQMAYDNQTLCVNY